MIVKLVFCVFNVLFLGMKSKSVMLIMTTAILLFLFAFTTDKQEKGDFESSKEVIVMRKIADQVMRYIGDSTSPILPVKQLSKNEFQIPFESSFAFMPDSLVSIINKVIASNKLPDDYIVQVKANGTDEVVYGYAFIRSSQQEIVPCSGRKQANQQYTIDILFKDHELISTKTLYLSSFGLLGLGFLFLGIQHLKKRKIETHTEPTIVEDIPTQDDIITIGRFQFYPEELLLKFDDEKIVLTIKEAKLLSIFAMSPNSTIDRSRLQKEVWEDEGVIVGRSLDVFISKLRKKLEKDSNVKLINIHSKGYKLEIGES